MPRPGGQVFLKRWLQIGYRQKGRQRQQGLQFTSKYLILGMPALNFDPRVVLKRIRDSVMACMGKESKKRVEIYIYICMTDSLCSTPETNTTL